MFKTPFSIANYDTKRKKADLQKTFKKLAIET